MDYNTYIERRKAKDKEDMKFYKQELLYWLRLIPIALFSYAVIWSILAILS